MPDWLNKFLDVIGDLFNSLLKTLDKLSLKIKENTGVNINLSVILAGVIAFIFIILVLKGILGWVSNSLSGS